MSLYAHTQNCSKESLASEESRTVDTKILTELSVRSGSASELKRGSSESWAFCPGHPDIAWQLRTSRGLLA